MFPIGQSAPQSGESGPPLADRRRWLYPLVLLALCGLLFFWRLGVTPLDDFDEAYYAEGAREMLVRGDLGTPYYNGEPFLLKPILIYWLIAGAFRLFGVTEFAARSVSAFFATVIVVETYWFARRRLGARAGLLAGIALASCYQWVDTGREAMIDMPLTAALAPAMFLLFLGGQAPGEGKRRLYLAAYPLLGIALLAKGPTGTLVSLGGLLGYLIWSRRLGRTLREAQLIPGIALVLAVAAPWYVYEGIKQPAFLQTFLLREPLGHLHGGLARNDAWWGQVKNLIVGFYPWVAFLPAAVVQALRREGIENRQQSAIEPASPGDCTGLDLLDCSAARRAARREVLAFSAWWALTVVVAFSLAGAKLPHYLAPAFPPMALLIAAWSESWVGGRAGTRLSEAVGFGLLGLIGLLLAGLAGIAVLMPAVVRERLALQFGCWTPGPAPVVMLTALAAGSLGAVGAAMAGRRRAVFPVLAVAMVAALIAHVGWLKPRLALIQSQPRKELAQFAGAALPADEPLGVFYAKRNATIFYARRPIVDLGEWDPGKLVSFLCTPTPATALTHAKFLPLLEEKLPGVELWTRRGEYVLVANHELSWRGADRGGPAAEGTAGTAFTAKTQRWQEHAPAQQSEDVKPQIAQIAQNRGVSPRPGLRQQATEGTAGTAFTAKVPKPAYGGPGWRPPKAA